MNERTRNELLALVANAHRSTSAVGRAQILDELALRIHNEPAGTVAELRAIERGSHVDYVTLAATHGPGGLIEFPPVGSTITIGRA